MTTQAAFRASHFLPETYIQGPALDSFSDNETSGTRGLGPGTILGQYQLRELLGQGGMGQVWTAFDQPGNRMVAVKILPSELRGNEEAAEQVRRAFGVVHSLTHQHIGKTIGLYDDAKHGQFIVMDLVSGITLSKFIRNYRETHDRLPLRAVVDLLRPVAEALDYAHKKGVLHRDIKPQNILVDAGQDLTIAGVTLIDFGLAAEIRSSMTEHTRSKVDTSGTRPYMSPEQFRGKRGEWDGRTDQYSLAVVAYHLLAGQLPFQGDDDMALMFAIVHEPASPVATQSDKVNTVLLRGLSKMKDDRYPSCVAMIDALEQAASDSQLSNDTAVHTSELPIILDVELVLTQWLRLQEIEFLGGFGYRRIVSHSQQTHWKSLARQGSSAAQFLLALEEPDEVSQPVIRDLASKSYPPALYELGRNLVMEGPESEGYLSGMEMLDRAANAGVRLARLEHWMAIDTEQYQTTSEKKTFYRGQSQALKDLAQEGMVLAMVRYGTALLEGSILDQAERSEGADRVHKAVGMLAKAVDAGARDAANALSRAYKRGKRLTISHVEAAFWEDKYKSMATLQIGTLRHAYGIRELLESQHIQPFLVEYIR